MPVFEYQFQSLSSLRESWSSLRESSSWLRKLSSVIHFNASAEASEDPWSSSIAMAYLLMASGLPARCLRRHLPPSADCAGRIHFRAGFMAAGRATFSIRSERVSGKKLPAGFSADVADETLRRFRAELRPFRTPRAR